MADSGRAGPDAPEPRPRRLIPLLLCAIALVVGIGWALATGPLNGPDESAHVAYVQHLAEAGDGPSRDTGHRPYSSQLDGLMTGGSFGPMVGHAEARPPWSALADLNRALGALPGSARSDGDGPNPLASNPPLYYAYEAVAYHLSPSANPLNRLLVLRLANVALFVATVALSWLLAMELFSALWPCVLTAGLVALQPKLGFMAGVVNSDTLLVTIATAFLVLSVRLVRRGPSLLRVVGVGALAAAGPMVHGRGFFLLPAGIVALAVGLWPVRREIRRSLTLAGCAVALMLIGVAIGFFWTRAHTGGSAFGGELGTAASGSGNVRQFLSYVWQFYFRPLSFMQPTLGPPYGYRQLYIETFFGTFGSLEVLYEGWVFDMLQLAAALGLAALGAAVLVRWQSVRRNARVVAIFAATFVSMIGLLHVAAYRHLVQGSLDPLVTGRYLLPCVALYATAVAWTLAAIGRRAGPWLAAALLAVSLLLTISGIGLTAWRFGA